MAGDGKSQSQYQIITSLPEITSTAADAVESMLFFLLTIFFSFHFHKFYVFRFCLFKLYFYFEFDSSK